MSVGILAVAQGVFYLATGAWSLVDIDSFMFVTGPKKDIWLVRTVGVLVSVIALVLFVDVFRGDVDVGSFVLAVGAAAGLAAVDIFYVAKKVISPVYLLDAAAEAILIVLWFVFMSF